MATITPGVTISPGQTVTRQNIYDLWALGTLGQLTANDLQPGTLPLISGTGTTSGVQPGTILFDGADQLYKVFVDEIDNTGCSLWLAFGPDRVEDAFIAAEPIPPGAAVRIASAGGRFVRRVDGWLDNHVIAFSQQGHTAPSGTWFAGMTAGIGYAWFPFKPASSGETGAAGAAIGEALVPCSWSPGGLCRNPGGFSYPVVIYGVPTHNVEPVTTASGGHELALIIYTGPRWGGT